MTVRVALLTDRGHAELTADDRLLLAALAARGCTVVPAQWTEPVGGFDVAVVRSCWDYQKSPQEFLAAITAWHQLCRVVNPIDTLRWNLDKRYLLALQVAGVNIPPSVIVPAGDRRDLGEVLAELGHERAVVKPVVGAAGRDTWLTGSAADRTLWEAGAGQDRIVQQFLAEVVTNGELSLIHFSNGYSHTVVKRPAAGEFRVQVEHGGHALSFLAERSVVAASERVLAAIDHEWSYARVDGVMVAGEFVLMELELIEPDLFFRADPAAADRAAALFIA